MPIIGSFGSGSGRGFGKGTGGKAPVLVYYLLLAGGGGGGAFANGGGGGGGGLRTNFPAGTQLELKGGTHTVTVAYISKQNATAYYNATVKVDGSAVTPVWQGGSAPTSGNVTSNDVYTYTAIKTAGSTFTVLASQTQFA